MNLLKFAQMFGVAFLTVGILGSVPFAAPNGMLLGIFHVNTAHNIVHILSGVVALACAAQGYQASKLYFQIFGVVYGLVAILGVFAGDSHILGLIANNPADVGLHVVISAAALYLGFATRTRAAVL